MLKKTITTLCFSLLLACNAEPTAPEYPSQGPFQAVEIEMTPAGPREVSRTFVTLEQQLAERAQWEELSAHGGVGIEQSALQGSAASQPNAVVLYDQDHYVGNKLFIYGPPGTLNFYNYVRYCNGIYCANWARAVHSYITHSHDGAFQDNVTLADGPAPTWFFTANEFQSNAPTIVRSSTMIRVEN